MAQLCHEVGGEMWMSVYTSSELDESSVAKLLDDLLSVPGQFALRDSLERVKTRRRLKLPGAAVNIWL